MDCDLSEREAVEDTLLWQGGSHPWQEGFWVKRSTAAANIDSYRHHHSQGWTELGSFVIVLVSLKLRAGALHARALQVVGFGKGRDGSRNQVNNCCRKRYTH